MDISFTFFTIAGTITKLFILMAIGYFSYNFRLVDDRFVDTLSLLLVRVVVPALIISEITGCFSFQEYPYWWFLPIAAILLSLAGMIAGVIVSRFFKGAAASASVITCSCGFQNCGYLPMNLILFSFTGMIADRLLVDVFLFIMGFNLLMWSLVPLFLSGKLKSGFNMKVFLNPPVIATVFSLIWVALLGKGSMPHIVMDPVRLLGRAAFPLSMFALGAYLCRHRAYDPEDKGALAACAAVKLFVFPAVVLLVLFFVPLAPDYRFFLFLQGIMPTAVSLVVIGSYTGINNNFFSSCIFYTHLIAFFSIPAWLAVYRILFL